MRARRDYNERLTAKRIGLLAALLVLAWWTLKVYAGHGGNWTALYCTGSRAILPPALQGESIYLFPDSWGYDGQFYHFIAHDPWLTRGMMPSVDNPPLRWRRILVSALAWTLALGRDAWIDTALLAVTLGFVFLGGYWLARYFEERGSPAWWGLLFVLSPTTLIVFDRIVVDIAVTALCCGFLCYAPTGRRGALWGVLAASLLARETGLVLLAGWCVWLLVRRSYRDIVLFATSALPAAAWWLYVERHTPHYGMPGWGISLPPMRLIEGLKHPPVYPLNSLGNSVLLAFDYLAVAGSVLAVVLAARVAWQGRGRLRYVVPAFGLFGFALTGTASPDVFQDVFSHARLLSPLTLLLAAEGLPRRDWLSLAPMAPASLRIGMLHAGLILKIVRAWNG
jgi:hypothetical protein